MVTFQSDLPRPPAGPAAVAPGRGGAFGHSPWRRAARRFIRQPAGVIGLVVVAGIIAVALLAPWIAPHDPLATGAGQELQPPSAAHLLGTDDLGRDLLSRLIFGARLSLYVGVLAVALGAVIGVASGLFAGYNEGRISELVMRLWDVIFAVPTVLFMIALAAALGRGPTVLAVAVATGSMPVFARLARAATRAESAKDYTEAAEVLGIAKARILARHILPNIAGTLMVQVALAMSGALLLESALSFLGLGAQAPDPSWGAMLADGRQFMRTAWWFVTFPGVAITLIVLGLNAMADALRDAFDPRGSR